MEASQSKSVYRYAADAGPWLALPLLIVAFSILLVNQIPSISILGLPAFAAVPFLLFRLMRRMALSSPAFSSFYPLWLFGIYSFIFATIICAFCSAVYLLAVEPDFLSTYFTNALQALRQMADKPGAPDLSSQIQIISQAIDRHMIPSPMELVAAMSWLCTFSGAVLSAFLARIFPLFSRRAKPLFNS